MADGSYIRRDMGLQIVADALRSPGLGEAEAVGDPEYMRIHSYHRPVIDYSRNYTGSLAAHSGQSHEGVHIIRDFSPVTLHKEL